MDATPTPAPANGTNGASTHVHVELVQIETSDPEETAAAHAAVSHGVVEGVGVEVRESPAPAPASAAPAVEFPDDLESLAQVLLYDNEANRGRPVRMACLDVRDLGGGLVVIVGKIGTPTRVRRLPDGAIVEAAAKSMIAVPVVSDLIQIPYEMASKPEGVLEAWFWPLPERQEIAPGLWITRYAVKGGWLEGLTKKDLLT